MIKNSKNRKILWIGAFLSLVSHVFFLPLKFDVLSSSAKEEIKKEKRIKIRFAKRSKSEKVKQIVATEKRKLDIKNDAKYLSKFENSTERQTKAKIVASFKKAGKGNAKINQKAQKMSQPVLSKANKKIMKKEAGLKKKISFKDFSFAKPTKSLRESPELVKGLKDASSKLRGFASNNDYLEDVPLGDMTQLNTKEFKYYGFYYRIKQKLEQHWGKTLKNKVERIYKKGGRFPASDKHLTSVTVILDKKGRILDVLVRGSSGVSELDDAAVEAFNSAGPFPNPPKGMILNGRASIEWGFAVSS